MRYWNGWVSMIGGLTFCLGCSGDALDGGEDEGPREFEVVDWRDTRTQVEIEELFTRQGRLMSAGDGHLVFLEGEDCVYNDAFRGCTARWVDHQGAVAAQYGSAMVRTRGGYAIVLHGLREVCTGGQYDQPIRDAPRWEGALAVVGPDGSSVWERSSGYLGGTGPITIWGEDGKAVFGYISEELCEDTMDARLHDHTVVEVVDPQAGEVVQRHDEVIRYFRRKLDGESVLIDRQAANYVHTLELERPDQNVELLAEGTAWIRWFDTRWVHYWTGDGVLGSYDLQNETHYQPGLIELSDGTIGYSAIVGGWVWGTTERDTYGRESYQIVPADGASEPIDLEGTRLGLRRLMAARERAILYDSDAGKVSLIDLRSGDVVVSADRGRGQFVDGVVVDGEVGILHVKNDRELYVHRSEGSELLFDRVRDIESPWWSLGVHAFHGLLVQTLAAEGEPTGGVAVVVQEGARLAELAHHYVKPRQSRGGCDSVSRVRGSEHFDVPWIYFAEIPDVADPDTITLNIVPADMSMPPVQLGTMARGTCRSPVMSADGKRVYWSEALNEADSFYNTDEEVRVYSAALP